MGFDFKTIAAGCSGGLSIVYALKKPEAWELIAGLVVGGLTANYLAPPLFTLLSTVPVMSSFPILAVAFLVGVGGKYICLTCLEYVKAWLPSKEQ